MVHRHGKGDAMNGLEDFGIQQVTEPKPGSVEAIQAGCLCSVLANGFGYGGNGQNGEKVYFVNRNCAVHHYLFEVKANDRTPMD